MANATDIVKKGVVRHSDEFFKESSATLSAATRFYRHALLGRTTGGYLAKFDDSQSLILVGVNRGDQESAGGTLLPAGTAGDGTIDLDYQQPRLIELAISGVAVTDINSKNVYALFDQTGTLDYAATTYANLIGKLHGYVASGIGLVELAYDGVSAHARVGAAKRVAATGTTTLTKWDLGKVIFCANTAAKSIILPAIADCPAGTWIKFIKDHASDANALTLDGADSEEINGSTTYAGMDAAYDTVTLVSNGARWVIDDNVA